MLRRSFGSASTLARPMKEMIAASVADAVVVGYPKTGNTWTRYLLGSYVRRLRSLDHVPLFDDAPLTMRGTRPRIRFTHGPLTWELQGADALSTANTVRPYRRADVVLLVRHPLDVLVSHWHHCAGRSPRLYDGSLAAFVVDPVFGIDKLLRFYELWAPEVGSTRLELVRYRDLRADPIGNLRRLIGRIGLPVVESAILQAVEDASFEQMRAVEQRDPSVTYRGGAPVFSPGIARGDAAHVRRGVVHGYRDELPATLIDELEARVAEELPLVYGYGPA